MDKVVSNIYHQKRNANQKHITSREVIDALKRKYEHDIAILTTKLNETPAVNVLAEPVILDITEPTTVSSSKSSVIRKGQVICKGTIH